jgi:hypothetical protein
MEMDAKSNSIEYPLKAPLRAFDAEGESNISRTALFAKAASTRLREKSNAKDRD